MNVRKALVWIVTIAIVALGLFASAGESRADMTLSTADVCWVSSWGCSDPAKSDCVSTHIEARVTHRIVRSEYPSNVVEPATKWCEWHYFCTPTSCSRTWWFCDEGVVPNENSSCGNGRFDASSYGEAYTLIQSVDVTPRKQKFANKDEPVSGPGSRSNSQDRGRYSFGQFTLASGSLLYTGYGSFGTNRVRRTDVTK